MIIPILLASVAISAASAGHICDQMLGWERAVEQRPSPVPYSEPVRNVAVQLSRGEWLWNGRKISETKLVLYLQRAKVLNPAPLNLFAFLPGLSCSDKRAMQAKMAEAAACPIAGKPCLDGTDAEYRAARALP